MAVLKACKYAAVILIACVLWSCNAPPADISNSADSLSGRGPVTVSIPEPAPVSASWSPSSKGTPKLRVETAGFTPFTDSVFDVKAAHPLAMAPDSFPLDLSSLPFTALDLKDIPATKVKPEIVQLGPPLKTKAESPVVEDKFAKGLMEMSQDQGLPGTAVLSLTQDPAGRLWMSTDNGVSLFNGEYIYTWLKRSGLSRDQKNTLCVDKYGHVWAAGNGVDEIIPEEGIVKHYGKQQGLTTNSAASAMIDRNGHVCILSNEGLDILDPVGGTVKHLGKKEGVSVALYINRMIEDREGRLWLAGNSGGVSIYDPARKKIFVLTEKQGLGNNDIRAIIEDRTGAIWLGGWNGGLDCFDYRKGMFYHFGRKHGLAFHYIHALMEDHRGKIWIAYLAAGADVYDPANRTISHIYGKEGVAKSDALSLLETRDSCVWIGTNGGGVLRYDPSLGDIYNYESKWWYTHQPVRALLEDREGKVWLSTSGRGVDIYDPRNRKIHHFEMSKDWTDAWQNVMVDDGKGHILMGSDYRFTLYDKKTNRVLSCGSDEGLIHSGTRGICVSGKDFIFGSGEGIEKCDSAITSFHHLDAPGDPCKTFVTCMTTDHNGVIWAGTYNAGVFRYDPSRSTLSHFSKAQGFGDNPIECILADHNNNIWAGTLGDGLKKLDGHSHLSTYTTESGLAEMAVTSLVEKDNIIYAGTAKGLSVIANDGKSIRNFGKLQGFRTGDFNSGTAVVSREGRIWWGIGDMLSIYTPADKKPAVSQTAITGISLMDHEQQFRDHRYMERMTLQDTIWSPARDTFYFRSAFKADTGYLKQAAVTWSGIEGPYEMPSGLKLPYQLDHVTFHFTGNYLSNTDKTRYRYVLEGNDVRWNAEVSTPYADYRNLSPGAYTFKVSSRNFNGPWSAAAVFSFEIMPPWWKTKVAYGLYVLCFAGSVIGYNRLRTKQLLARQRELEQNVKERTAEIVHQKNEIESQKALVEEKQKEIVDSINYARRIQFTLLAHEKVLKKHFTDHFVLFQPKDIVSGDFYWATRQGNRFYLAVCDSTGHGVPGAFMSLLNISFLNEAIIEKDIREPNLVLDYVRDRLIKSISREGRQDGMDGILICIEEGEHGEKKKITYAAANNNPMLYSHSRLNELPGSKMPIGKGERMSPFVLYEIKAEKNDMLYLYTDGFADQFGGPAGKKFKYKKLNELLQANANADVTVQHDALLRTLNEWKAGLEQVDDICVLGLRL